MMINVNNFLFFIKRRKKMDRPNKCPNVNFFFITKIINDYVVLLYAKIVWLDGLIHTVYHSIVKKIFNIYNKKFYLVFQKFLKNNFTSLYKDSAKCVTVCRCCG